MQYTNDVISFDSGVDGFNLLVFGGIHGNEHSGVKAILKFIDLLNNNEISILKGKVTFAFGNLEALKVNKRYLDKDMNRMFVDDNFEQFKDLKEYKRVEFLKSLFKGNHAFLDLHSATNPTEDFLLAEAHSLDIAKNLSPSFVVSGWENFASVTGDTETYAASIGLKSMTYESGQHDDLKSIENSFNMICKFLANFGVIKFNFNKSDPICLNLFEIFIKTSDSQILAKDFSNFSFVKKNELIINGDQPIYAPVDGYLVFPVDPSKIKIGEEICFIANTV